MASAERTAAAGAQGAVIKRELPPNSGETSPSAVAPRMPARAPCAASEPPNGAKMVTPNAIAAGNATSMEARPPNRSPGRFATENRLFNPEAIL